MTCPVTRSQEVVEPRFALKNLTPIPASPCLQLLLSKELCFQPFGPFVAPDVAHESKERVPDPRIASPRLKRKDERGQISEDKFSPQTYQLKPRGKMPDSTQRARTGEAIIISGKGKLRTKHREQSGEEGEGMRAAGWQWESDCLICSSCSPASRNPEQPHSSSSKELAMLQFCSDAKEILDLKANKNTQRWPALF